MKYLLITFFLFFSLTSIGQSLRSYNYGKLSLTGKVVLKDLRHPINGKVIKDAMVLVLPQPVKFIPNPESEEEDTATTREIRIYGDIMKNVNPNMKYKAIIGKKVTITANYEFAPSGNYPLLVNIIEDFSYKIIE
ncbi:hypothetical protein F0919_07475 [Taibaiella lutea]|uniref:Uncharacterized protein n=1 Tax=Taibaiella lutea TaxID=2608001 RepID=A0A5M6CHJ7_9BACT|nr:hypothetical protein [Taibaiella lutea]KAA5534456.1 hypothetical protein F0919_07475 [Taibaiella lutea]